MRFFRDFPEAINELQRELKEMGIEVHTKSVQNKQGDFKTLELQNYTYTVLYPDPRCVILKCPEWAEAEFADRISGNFINPGTSYKLREDLWGPLLNKYGRFDYWYPERMAVSLPDTIDLLKRDINTRRAFCAVFSLDEDHVDNLDRRIPCTIGYWFNYRNNKLNMTYLLRSSDFSEHFNYDIWLATKLLQHVAAQVGVQSGTFTHWIGSFHVFEKDVANVF